MEAWHKRYWIYDDADDPPVSASIGDTVTAENFESASGQGFDVIIVPTVNKYWEDGSLGRLINDADGYRNIIQYRVSQAYLIAAEAYMKAGDPVTAQQYLDALRNARGGLASIPVTMENILDEHARELGLEGHRYPMLKRLGIWYDRVNANPDWSGIVLEHQVRWPIPQKILNTEASLMQNPGY